MIEEPDLSGKTALVTGGSRGIGSAIARRMAAAGAAVVVTGRSLSAPVMGSRAGAAVAVTGTLEDTVRLIEAAGGRAFALAADIEDEAQCRTLVARAAEIAGRQIDILVNNAGFADFGPIADMPLEVFDRTFMHYVRAPFLLSQAAIPYMRSAGAGWIVNISSQDALPPGRPFPSYEKDRGYAAYAAAKAAINRLTQGLAAELEPDNIAVNVVGPSTAIRTPGADALIPSDFPTEDVEYLAETVLAMCHLPANRRTGLIASSLHFPWHHDLQVRNLDGSGTFPPREPPAWSHPGISASGEY